jgi:hypothetical protein
MAGEEHGEGYDHARGGVQIYYQGRRYFRLGPNRWIDKNGMEPSPSVFDGIQLKWFGKLVARVNDLGMLQDLLRSDLSPAYRAVVLTALDKQIG